MAGRWAGSISIPLEKIEMRGSFEGRSWLEDTKWCIDQIQTDVFSLEDVYQFEATLSEKHPENNNVRAKIRQQLQQLRDRGYIEFLGSGVYRKR